MISACFAISNADKTSCSDHFYTSSSSANYRTGCCLYKHEHSNGCHGARARTTTRSQLSFCSLSVPPFFFQYAHFTQGTSSSDAHLTSCSWGLSAAEQGSDEYFQALPSWLLCAKEPVYSCQLEVISSKRHHQRVEMRHLRDRLDSAEAAHHKLRHHVFLALNSLTLKKRIQRLCR